MTATRRRTVAIVLCWILPAVVAMADPPTCTVHFFDWYVVSDRSPLAEIQKRWTYQVDWKSLDIAPEDIGNTVHYYEVQCQKIREAGFDGIHYEWHGNPVKPVFREALQKTNLPVAMFYDMEIRFSGQGQFITPTDEFAKTVRRGRRLLLRLRTQVAVAARSPRLPAHCRLRLCVRHARHRPSCCGIDSIGRSSPE